MMLPRVLAKMSLLVFVMSIHCASSVLASELTRQQVPQAETPKNLRTYMSALRLLTEQQDLEAFRPQVRETFYMERDFGGVFDESKPAFDNFVYIFGLSADDVLPEYLLENWNSLKSLLSETQFEYGNDDAFCTSSILEGVPYPNHSLCFDKVGDRWAPSPISSAEGIRPVIVVSLARYLVVRKTVTVH